MCRCPDHSSPVNSALSWPECRPGLTTRPVLIRWFTAFTDITSMEQTTSSFMLYSGPSMVVVVGGCWSCKTLDMSVKYASSDFNPTELVILHLPPLVSLEGCALSGHTIAHLGHTTASHATFLPLTEPSHGWWWIHSSKCSRIRNIM